MPSARIMMKNGISLLIDLIWQYILGVPLYNFMNILNICGSDPICFPTDLISAIHGYLYILVLNM